MSNELIGLETAIEWAKVEIAIEGEDFVYRAEERDGTVHLECAYYEKDGAPSCLVGRILDRHGLMTFEGRGEHEGKEAFSITPVTKNFTAKARSFLNALQIRQDSGETWGMSLGLAIEYVESL